MEESDKNNKHIINLNSKLEILKKCQDSNNINSCLKCEKIINCEIRNEYVESVYLSMNNGSGGFFNFEA